MPAKAKPSRTTPVRTPEPAPWHASKGLRLGALGIVAAAAAVTAAVLIGTAANSPPGTRPVTVTPVGPVALTASGLETLVGDLNQVIYWVGPVAGDRYELTRTTTNDVYVRYLPRGVAVGTHQGKYLLVATYPFAGAFAALKATDNGRPLKVAGGKHGIAVVERGSPTNVRVAFPSIRFQLEIYDPSARKARQFATSAALTPVP